MDKTLYLAANEGSLVLTVNDRLSRNLSQQYDQVQQEQGAATWLRPEILGLSAWLKRCQTQVAGLPHFLNQVQLQYVWFDTLRILALLNPQKTTGLFCVGARHG